MTQPQQVAFPRWRSYLWPIYSFELKKLLPMLMMMLLITFNYTIFRDTKDTLVVHGTGAEALPYLKFWGVLPGAIIYTLIYAKLANIMKRENLFYALMIPFLIFFGLFAYWMYPNKEALTPVESAQTLQRWLPASLEVVVRIYKDWTSALFYIFAELWGTVCISLLFWGFANDTTRVQEAKRFYAMFGLGASFGQFFAGGAIRALANTEGTAWSAALQQTLGISLISGLIILGLYYYMQNVVLKDPEFAPAEGDLKAKKSKPKLSIKDSISLLSSSRYLLSIAVLVMSYGILINICEVPWKGFLKQAFTTQKEYQAFMGAFSMYNSTLTVLMMLFVGGNVIRKLGWYAGAVFTPLVLAVTGSIFFSLVIFQGNLDWVSNFLNIKILTIVVFIGTVQNIVTKSSKYALFDPTKEMTYIPLDADSKTKGKAAIDVVGARLGKSGGSLIFMGLFQVLGNNNLVACAPYLFVVLLFVSGAWIKAVGTLNGEFAKINRERDSESKLEAKI